MLLKIQKSKTIKLFGTYKNTPNTGYIKTEGPQKQRNSKIILGEGCGRLDGGKRLEIGTNNRRAADVWNICQGYVRKRVSEREEEGVDYDIPTYKQ